MERFELAPRSIDADADYYGPETIDELRRAAEPGHGLRVLHVNAPQTMVARLSPDACNLIRGTRISAARGRLARTARRPGR
jgi:hypothetical protein